MKTVIAACLAGLFTSAAWATTWAPTKVDEPLNDGRCDVFAVASCSYAYSGPERRDGVFWPLSASHFQWVCGQGGFVWLGWDSEQGIELTQAERAWIAAYLETMPALDGTPDDGWRSDDAATYYTVERRFEHFQTIAELRDLETDLERRVLSAQAHYDERIVGDSAGSVDAPCQAIPITQPLIAADEDSLETVLLMAVLGDYTHEVGDDAGGEDEGAGLE